MAQQAELTSAPPAAVTVFINYRVRVVANRAEQFTRAEDGFPQVLAHLGFSWYLIEFVHVHNFTSFLWTVPSGLDYPKQSAKPLRKLIEASFQINGVIRASGTTSGDQ